MKFMLTSSNTATFISCDPAEGSIHAKHACYNYLFNARDISSIETVYGNLNYGLPKYGEFGLAVHMKDGKTESVQVLPDPADHDKLLKEDLEKNPLNEENYIEIEHRCWAIELLNIMWDRTLYDDEIDFQGTKAGSYFEYYKSFTQEVENKAQAIERQVWDKNNREIDELITDLEKKYGKAN